MRSKSNEFYLHLKVFLDSKHDTHREFCEERYSEGVYFKLRDHNIKMEQDCDSVNWT
jgi:hypothetical protein